MKIQADINYLQIHVNKLSSKCQLIDTITAQNPAQRTLATHIRGSKRIDTILVSNTLSKHIVQSQILEFDEIINSDHRALVCDINIMAITHSLPLSTTSLQRRQLTLDSPTAMTKYISTLTKSLKAHKIHESLQILNMTVNTNNPSETQKENFKILSQVIEDSQIIAEDQSKKIIRNLCLVPTINMGR